MSLRTAKAKAVNAWTLDEAAPPYDDQVGTSDFSTSGTVLSAAGKFGNAARFNGSADPGVLRTGSALPFLTAVGTGHFCFRAWVRIPAGEEGGRLVTQNVSGQGFNADLTLTFLSMSVSAAGGGSGGSGFTTFAPDVWHLVHIWREPNGAFAMAVDNVTLVSESVNGTIAPTSPSFQIGGRLSGIFSHSFQGLIDDPVLFFNYHMTAEERTEDWTTQIPFALWAAPIDSAQVEAAEAIVTALNEDVFSQAFTAVRSYAQWQRPFEVAEALGLQVDVIPFAPMDDELDARKSVEYMPAIDVVIRKKFTGTDVEPVPGQNQARVKTSLVDGLVALLEEIHQALVAQRLGSDTGIDPDGEIAWDEDRILATYIPAHLRDKHQYTGVIRRTHRVHRDLPA